MAYVVIMCPSGFGMNTSLKRTLLSGGRLLLVGRGSQGIDDHKHHDFGGEQGNDNLLTHGRFKDIHVHLGRLLLGWFARLARRDVGSPPHP